MPARRSKVFGRHVIADPKICHGKLTFVGTRILVAEGHAPGYGQRRLHGPPLGPGDRSGPGHVVRPHGQGPQRCDQRGRQTHRLGERGQDAELVSDHL